MRMGHGGVCYIPPHLRRKLHLKEGDDLALKSYDCMDRNNVVLEKGASAEKRDRESGRTKETAHKYNILCLLVGVFLHEYNHGDSLKKCRKVAAALKSESPKKSNTIDRAYSEMSNEIVGIIKNHYNAKIPINKREKLMRAICAKRYILPKNKTIKTLLQKAEKIKEKETSNAPA